MRARVLHSRRPLAVIAALLAALGGAPLAAAAADPGARTTASAVGYLVPAPGRVVRGFEVPATAFGPGHRGVDLAARPGDPVVVAADGRVVHAGAVAGTTWVSVDHADGIRTAYGPLTALAVAHGDEVSAGGELGRLALGGHGHRDVDEGLHFSARRDGVHIDPLALFAPGRPSLVGPGSRAPHGDATGPVFVPPSSPLAAPAHSLPVPAVPTPGGARPAAPAASTRGGARPAAPARSLSVDDLPAGPLPSWSGSLLGGPNRHAHHTRSLTGDPGAPRLPWGGSQSRLGTAAAGLESDPG